MISFTYEAYVICVILHIAIDTEKEFFIKWFLNSYLMLFDLSETNTFGKTILLTVYVYESKNILIWSKIVNDNFYLMDSVDGPFQGVLTYTKDIHYLIFPFWKSRTPPPRPSIIVQVIYTTASSRPEEI